MELRLFPRWLGALLVVFAALSFHIGTAHADVIAVQRASLEADEGGGWNLDAHFEFTLNNSLTELVNKGIPLYFTTEFTLTRPRWYWFDDRALNVSRSVKLSFQPLMREYRVSFGGLQLGFATLDEALAMVRHVASWHVIDRGSVSMGQTYIAAVRMRLDLALMPKPFQIDAVNNRDWSLGSDWRRFDFTPSDYAAR